MDETERLHRLRYEIRSLEISALDKGLSNEQVETIKHRLAVLRSLVSQMEAKDTINDDINDAVNDILRTRNLDM